MKTSWPENRTVKLSELRPCIKNLIRKNTDLGVFKSKKYVIERWKENDEVKLCVARLDESGRAMTWIKVVS
jgi:hypothetical protein